MPELLVKKEGPIARLVFSNPPKFNAISFDMWSDLPKRFKELEADPAIRVIILEGEGEKAFAAGADISKFADRQQERDMQKVHEKAVEQGYLAAPACTKPVIAKIRGVCMGGGLGMAVSCDLRFCSDDARFRMPAARLGIGYNLAGVRRFIQTIGVQNTFDIFYTARIFNAADAQRMGLVMQSVPADQLDRVVDEYAARVANNAPLSIRSLKLCVTESFKDKELRDMDAISQAILDCAASTDHAEGARAFMEKREPVFESK